MSQPFAQPSPLPTKKRKSKGLLITGLVLLGLALLGLITGVFGVRAAVSGIDTLQNQVGDKMDTISPDRPRATLKVPGTTICPLEKGNYIIWVKPSESGQEQWDPNAARYHGPPIQWSITGPDGRNVEVKEGGQFNIEGQIALCSFQAEQAGDYTILAAAGGDFSPYEFLVFDFISDEELKRLAKDVGKAAGGFLLMLGGFAVAGLFGLIGLILVIIYLVS